MRGRFLPPSLPHHHPDRGGRLWGTGGAPFGAPLLLGYPKAGLWGHGAGLWGHRGNVWGLRPYSGMGEPPAAGTRWRCRPGCGPGPRGRAPRGSEAMPGPRRAPCGHPWSRARPEAGAGPGAEGRAPGRPRCPPAAAQMAAAGAEGKGSAAPTASPESLGFLQGRVACLSLNEESRSGFWFIYD